MFSVHVLLCPNDVTTQVLPPPSFPRNGRSSFSLAALRSHGKSATFRQHYYPEGNWGWVIAACCFLANVFTTGLQLSFGVLQVRQRRQMDYGMQALWEIMDYGASLLTRDYSTVYRSCVLVSFGFNTKNLLLRANI